jgi:hypothetical protein
MLRKKYKSAKNIKRLLHLFYNLNMTGKFPLIKNDINKCMHRMSGSSIYIMYLIRKQQCLKPRDTSKTCYKLECLLFRLGKK